MKISRLTLYTNNLSRQKAFYKTTLGLPLVNETEGSATVLLQNTEVTFSEKPGATPYHFAINIPSDSIGEALKWLKKRVAILTDEGHEIQDFPAWNAKSVYFYDTDNNIVELISRRNLDYTFSGPFNSASLIEVSEIGMAVQEISPYYKKLKETAGLELFDGNLEEFSAIGDEYGLFICVNQRSKTWYPTGDKAHASDFELVFTKGKRKYIVLFRREILKINSK